MFVTHDQTEVLALADRMAVMKDGRIPQVGTPREFFHAPATSFISSFIGSHPMNLNCGVISPGMLESLGVSLPAPTSVLFEVREGQDVQWGTCTENVERSASECPHSVSREVATVENLGAQALLSLRIGDSRFQAVVDEEPLSEVGQKCWFTFPVSKTLFFDVDSGERIGGGEQ